MRTDVVWTKEQCEARITRVMADIAGANKEMNDLNSRIAEIKQRKLYLRRKISKLHVYANLVRNQPGNQGEWTEL